MIDNKDFLHNVFFSLTRIKNGHMHLFYIHHEHVLYIVYFFTTAQSLFLDIFVSCYFFKTQTTSNLSEQNLALLMLFFVKQNLSQNFPLHWKKQTQVQAGRIHHNIFFFV